MENGVDYFWHDVDAFFEPKIQALIAEHDATGYGIYWRIIEMLHHDVSNKLEHKPYVIKSIARQLSITSDEVNDVIDYCINECELFGSDGKHFWSLFYTPQSIQR